MPIGLVVLTLRAQSRKICNLTRMSSQLVLVYGTYNNKNKNIFISNRKAKSSGKHCVIVPFSIGSKIYMLLFYLLAHFTISVKY